MCETFAFSQMARLDGRNVPVVVMTVVYLMCWTSRMLDGLACVITRGNDGIAIQ